MKAVAMMLKAIHAQESKEAAREKACQVAEKLLEMKLSSAAKKLQDGIEETLTYMVFPPSTGPEFVPTIRLSG
jgi:transposase-like protein